MGGDNNIPDIFYIIQNNIQNVNNFQEQVLSPDAEEEDVEGFNNLVDLLRLPALLREEGFWIVQYSLTRDIDENYHHYHLSWDHEIPNINDNPDLVNAIRFINIEQNGGRKRRKKMRKKAHKKTRKRRRRTRKKRGGKKKKLTAKEYWKPKRFLGKTWWMPRKLKAGAWFHDTLKYGIPI